MPFPLRRRAVPGALAALAATGALLLSACGGGAPPDPSGTFEADEIDLSCRVEAPCLEVRVDEGDAVAAGDTLVVLDTEILRRQRAEAAARIATFAAQRTAADAAVRQARDELALARTTLARIEALHGQGSATAQQVDEARTRRDRAALAVEAAQQERSALDARIAEVEAQVRVFDRRIEDGVLLAPVDGIILLRAVEPGEIAGPRSLALRLADLSRLELRVYLEAEDLDRVRLGGTYPIRVDALGEETLEGVLSWVSEEAEFTPDNVQTREARAQLVYAVELRVENPDGRLKIGMPAELVLPAADAGR